MLGGKCACCASLGEQLRLTLRFQRKGEGAKQLLWLPHAYTPASYTLLPLLKKKTKDRKQDIQAISVLSSSEHALICVFVTCVTMCICPRHVHLEVRGHHQGRPLSASSFATGLLSDPSAHGLFRTHKQWALGLALVLGLDTCDPHLTFCGCGGSELRSSYLSSRHHTQ